MMKHYFIGHKDSQAINEYLNNLSDDSADFQVVYQLRKMGEEFNEGIIYSLSGVTDCQILL